MALFGGIIYVDRPLRETEKIVAIALYSEFALVNYMMVSNQLELLTIMYNEISSNFQNDQKLLVRYFVERSNAGWFDKADFYSQVVHSVMLIIVVLTVIFDKRQ